MAAVRRKDGSYARPRSSQRNAALQSLEVHKAKKPSKPAGQPDSSRVNPFSSDLAREFGISLTLRNNSDINISFVPFHPNGLIWALRQRQPEERKLTNDVVSLILLYLDWGPKLDKIFKLIDKDLTPNARAILARYNVANGPGKLSDKKITLDLVSYAFPEVTANLLHKGQGKAIGRLGALPRALASPSGASLIPESWDNMSEAWRQWAVRFVGIVSQNVPEGQKSDSFKFLVNAEFKDGDKLAVLRQLGINRDLEE